MTALHLLGKIVKIEKSSPIKVTFQSDRCHLGDKLEQPRKGSVKLLYVT
jgi:hypothetical protein